MSRSETWDIAHRAIKQPKVVILSEAEGPAFPSRSTEQNKSDTAPSPPENALKARAVIAPDIVISIIDVPKRAERACCDSPGAAAVCPFVSEATGGIAQSAIKQPKVVILSEAEGPAFPSRSI